MVPDPEPWSPQVRRGEWALCGTADGTIGAYRVGEKVAQDPIAAFDDIAVAPNPRNPFQFDRFKGGRSRVSDSF